MLLGLVVEKVTGLPFGEYLRQKIFDPLGLKQTSYPPNGLLPEPYMHGYYKPFGESTIDTSLWNPAVAAGAGQVMSTYKDLKAWLPAVATGATLAASTHADRLAHGRDVASGMSYAFAIADYNGWLGHDGDIPGYVTIALYLPEKKATLVIIANSEQFAHASTAGHRDDVEGVTRPRLSESGLVTSANADARSWCRSVAQ